MDKKLILEKNDIILRTEIIFNSSLNENGLYVGFPNNSEIVNDVIKLCKKHNILWTYGRYINKGW